MTSYEVFYLYMIGDDIFRTLERIESTQPYYTTLIKHQLKLRLPSLLLQPGKEEIHILRL